MLRTQLPGIRSSTYRTFSILSTLKQNASSSSPAKPKSNKQPSLTQIDQFENLSDAQIAYLDRVIRVDQAGELGANYIYQGQQFILSEKYPHLRPILRHMWLQEVHHHNTFNELQIRKRVRPSLLTPLWKVGAIAMGAGTALISPRAAMACTEAVETVIGRHYNEQLRCLTNQFQLAKVNEKGETGMSPEVKDIVEKIRQFRDDELEHLDTAIENDSKLAVPYKVITEGVKTVCRIAVWTAERI
ncbi:putative monooxygenase CAT5 NDAI_0C01540 [Naumovozyma dairenensis CBS 421]|uniref:5-demethoxyubiquinone hydroxylase, mitochondrial n=1 Tax=Naumovozyma dairenensis (strain ATCC 10597 / BCRC 20456 / CBS 421 / NBRC 0211 / NRRL Y-12639) TaxID=1071378 RepID=G0W7Q4_NAUDC|nr:hypothetical protein NDAI_0C01540 [Naumovozyma dairenensis CBS 421]CCD23815.1 hypothetical protein NDAI_0C01540 [Naumovozyma dairenensis CBS 421]